jgi:hypothetical protein
MMAKQQPTAYNLTAAVQLVTPELAKKLRVTCPFERQRPINQDHVKRLAVEMSLGWFLAGTPVWFCKLPDGQRMIVNGNHTLEAIASGQVSVPLTFITQTVKDVEEAAQSYICFDIQRSRTWMQAAQGVGLDQTTPMLAPALSAMSHIMADFKDVQYGQAATVKSRRARFDEMTKYQSALAHLSTLFQGTPDANQRVVKRAATFAIAMVTMQAQPSTAENFWGELLKDDGLRVGDPRHTLLRYLSTKTARVAQRDLLIGTALAWNAFYEDRPMAAIKPGQARQFRIAGTSWHSGHPIGRAKITGKKLVVEDESNSNETPATVSAAAPEEMAATPA